MQFDCLILAAGTGTRMRPLTEDRPKCFIEFNGQTLIEQQLNSLKDSGVKDIDIVTGYMANNFVQLNCNLIENEEYDASNMVYSCLKAKHVFYRSDRDLLIHYADVLMGSDAIRKAMTSSADIVLLSDTNWLEVWEKRFANPCDDAESFVVDGDRVLDLGKPITRLSEPQGQFTGVFKISGNKRREFIDKYQELFDHKNDLKYLKNLYMTDYLRMLIAEDWKIEKKDIQSGWLEFDSVSDLELYTELLRNGELSGFFPYDIC